MILTAALLLLFCLFVPLLQGLITATSNAPTNWAGWASPSLAYLNAMEASYLKSPSLYWSALGGSHLVAWLMIAIASLLLPRSWQDKPKAESPAPIITLRELPQNAPNDPPVVGARRNRELLNEDPLLWLIGERPGVKAGVWGVCGLWLLIVFIGVLSVGTEVLTFLMWIAWLGMLGVKVLFTSEACRFFAATRRAGAFEFLLSTPINANRLVSAQWASLRRVFGPPLIAAGGGTGVAIAMALVIHNSRWEDFLGFSVFGAGISGAVLLLQVLDLFALAWLGMWLALTMKKPQLAVGATLLYVIVLPWLTVCYAWFFGFILDIILIAVFATKMNSNLRQILTSRPQLLAVAPK